MVKKDHEASRINPIAGAEPKLSSKWTNKEVKSRSHHLTRIQRYQQFEKSPAVKSRTADDVTKSREPEETKEIEENNQNLRCNQKREQFKDILRKYSLTKQQFVDEDFPPSKVSLLRSEYTRKLSKRYDSEVEFEESVRQITNWQRPENVRGCGNEDWVFVKDPKPSDICQGELGNCWFVAALALIAERKELLSQILAISEVNSAGAYMLRLFKDGVWECVIVDSFLPCNSLQKLVFSSCQRKQLWVPLIEKAMAKLHGSYESLQSGSIWDGLNYLTGFVSERIFLKSEEDRELLWGRLLSFSSCGFLMGTSITSTKSVKEKGLVINHVYSILRVVCENGNRLIQLKNPWGRFSWNGDWSDSSDLWTVEMKQKLSPNLSNEGIFWMCFHDFLKYFTCIDVCKVRKNWHNYTFEGLLPPCVDTDCQPCFELICKNPTCELDISVYQSSKRNSKEIIKLTDIGFMVIEVDGARMGQKLIQTVELVKSEQRRCVTTSIMLNKGRYFIVPFSFGHWTLNCHEEIYHTFTLTIQSSRKLSCSRVPSSSIPYLFADAFICCAKKYGTLKKYSMKGKYDDILTTTINLGLGYCTVVENRSANYVEFQMNSETSSNYTTTRGTLQICDSLPPYHSQVLQVLAARDAKKSSKISNSYQLQLLHDNHYTLTKESEKLQSPPLVDRNIGLHKPRPLNVN